MYTALVSLANTTVGQTRAMLSAKAASSAHHHRFSNITLLLATYGSAHCGS